MTKLILLCLVLLALLAVVLVPPAGCNHSRPSGSGLRTVQMRIGAHDFTLEVADSEGAREYGLMQRDSMPRRHGMIFIFPEERELSFWMKNTRIPLDIIYLDAQGRVVSIKQMKPYDLNGTPSDGPAQYAIELNHGAAADAGVRVGDQLVIPESARRAR